MPTYSYRCPARPDDLLERVVPIAERDEQYCEICGIRLVRGISSPIFKFAGRVTPGGGPDRFTADMLGIPLKDLPDGLKTPEQPE